MTMRQRLGRAWASVSVALVVIAGLNLGLMTPAHADADGIVTDANPTTSASGLHLDEDGYFPLRDKTVYMASAIGIAQVDGQGAEGAFLHLGPEDEDGQGFWFATRVEKSNLFPRGFTWVHARYGIKCSTDTRDVTFNPWLNRYACMIAPQRSATIDVARTQSCITTNGRPWEYAKATGSCYDSYLNPKEVAYTTKPTPGTGQCGPGEPTGLNDHGTNACDAVTYPWMTHPDPVPFMAGPDSCTGLPTTTNTGRGRGWAPDTAGHMVWVGQDLIASGVPGCTGDNAAPNCTAATSDSPACGGPIETTTMVPVVGEAAATPVRTAAAAVYSGAAVPVSVTGTALRAAEATHGHSSAVARQTVSKTVKAYQVKARGKWRTVTAKAYAKAKRKHQKVRVRKQTARATLLATGTVGIVVARHVTKSVTLSVQVPSVSYVASRFGNGATYEEAYENALAAASTAVQQKASSGQGGSVSPANSAVETARQRAEAEAAAQAATAAAQAAREASPTAAEIASAQSHARAAAKAALARKVATWRRMR